MLKEIFEGIEGTRDESDLFTYFDVIKGYEVSVNFIDEGAEVPTHTHNKEVYNLVLEGDFVCEINGETKTYKKGDWLNIKANVPHSVEAKTAVALLELWKK